MKDLLVKHGEPVILIKGYRVLPEGTCEYDVVTPWDAGLKTMCGADFMLMCETHKLTKVIYGVEHASTTN